MAVDTTLLDLDMDSLTFVAVLGQVEAVYGFDLGPDEVLGLLEAANVAELVATLDAVRRRV